jgi:DtxR family transcriptional regulator, Mn-dependent transcriptional regulator
MGIPTPLLPVFWSQVPGPWSRSLSVPVLTQAIQDYLKVTYQLRQSGATVTTNAVAQRLDVAPASASNMIKKLARLELVHHTPYHGVALTPGGEKIALEVIRHHRLIELYLARHLGIALDQVDAEADRLEHVISEELEDRIAQSLGEPTHDPHGDPIPSRDGAVVDVRRPRLAELQPGQRGVVARVSDRDPAVLRGIAEQRLVPGVAVRVMAVAADGSMRLRAGRTDRRLSSDEARAVYVDLVATDA